MSLTIVTWEDLIEEWERNPERALEWIISLLFRAGISPKDSAQWLVEFKKKRIVIGKTFEG